MIDIWMQGRQGRPIDLINPASAEVDFREIADTLADINRYNGAALKQISVAAHTLIVCDAAPDAVKPWALLHDAHEARIGDITTPVQMALGEIARAHHPEGCRIFHDALRDFKTRHDAAIYAAAGLSLPSIEQQAAIKRADLIALVTERRDFLHPSARRWAVDIEGLTPLRKVYRLRAAPDVADELFARFQTYLPALARRA